VDDPTGKFVAARYRADCGRAGANLAGKLPLFGGDSGTAAIVCARRRFGIGLYSIRRWRLDCSARNARV